MVQILIWYFVIGTVINDLLSAYGIGQISAFWYGVASLACFAGAYVTEIVRAGIQSIHRGQTEAARSLGMTYAQSMRHIILPQALRRILPPLAGQFISLIKDSSLLGIIAIRELTKAAREVVTTTLQPFEVYFLLRPAVPGADLYPVDVRAISRKEDGDIVIRGQETSTKPFIRPRKSRPWWMCPPASRPVRWWWSSAPPVPARALF